MRKLDADERWDLSYKVTGMLSEASEPQHAVDEILECIGEAMEFVAGAFWVVDEVRVALRSTTFWTAQQFSFPSFELVTRVRSFGYGDGLPGTAWKLREPVWFSDITRTSNFPRASVAALENLHTAVGFPAYQSRRVFGVFEYFSTQNRSEDTETQKFLSALGAQVGLFLQHYGISDVIQEGDRLRIAAERSLDAVVTIDENSTVIYVNTAISRLLGYAPEELMGGNLSRIIPEQLRAAHDRGLRRYIETGKRKLNWGAIDFPSVHKDGTIVPIRVAFGEFWRSGQRVFTGFIRPAESTHL
jgi:PAS domain S-box-containing protein